MGAPLEAPAGSLRGAVASEVRVGGTVLAVSAAGSARDARESALANATTRLELAKPYPTVFRAQDLFY